MHSDYENVTYSAWFLLDIAIIFSFSFAGNARLLVLSRLLL